MKTSVKKALSGFLSIFMVIYLIVGNIWNGITPSFASDEIKLVDSGKNRVLMIGDKIDTSYNGKFTYKGITYVITDGKVTGGITEAETNAVKVLNKVGWNIKPAYYWCVDNIKFTRDKPSNDESYGFDNFANQAFTQHKGNCFCYASAFYYMGRMLNADIHIVKGNVPYRAGGVGIHCWNEIVKNGKTYVCDAEFEHERKSNGRSDHNGYMFTYGTKGTWKYSSITPLI